ncbi:MAG: DUF1989 domain-containing protein [Proteobacteria bacterium]|nr:DUF1989 domain-containing protein [Pseudomonadota bacterium]
MLTNTISPERIREPGLYLSRLGMERYVIVGGGVLALPLYQGDKIEVVDLEGLQQVHVAGFDEQGNSCVGRLGLTETESGKFITESLESSGASARRMLVKLERINILLNDARVSSLLTGETFANSSATFECEEDVLALIAAPGLPMSAENPHPPTDIIVYIERDQQRVNYELMLPEPLADSAKEKRIDHSTAVAYEVKKGEYIQLIDVQGRQCFDKAKLEMGVEKCLDATTTRSLMGNTYPGPGLNSKFYSVDFEAMVEVIQDTCGRHDSFGLACTSKYYDDAGYPGHANCSENFNNVLSSYPIAPRKGWMAMNLFYNTFFDDAHQFMFEDSWSRPGDYVLMRALMDLVCVSSSCPDDIDPANGWVPTDIHLRTYSEKNLFKRAIAFRKTTDAEPEMTKETGFHKNTSLLTRNFTEYNGYWLANNFIKYGAVAEYWACREKVIMTDLSPLRKYEVIGPDAELLLQTCVTRDIRKLAVGQVVYTAMCYESGGMIDDGTVFRLSKDNFRWIGGNDTSGLWLRQQAEERKLRVWVKDSTSQLNNLQIEGPNSREFMEEIIWTRPDQASIEELGVFRFSIARIKEADGIPILISRTGYTGESGYEVFCHPNDAEPVWNIIWDAGQKHGIAPLGLEALDMLRIEAGLIFAGHEFCDQTDPFEAGIGFTAPLKSKQDDFIGKEALIKRKEYPQEKLTGLELVGEETASHGDGVYIGKEQIGTVTSGTISPILSKNIALCKMKVEYSEIGKEAEIGKLDGHQKRIPATVSPFPHFDPKKERVKGNY